MGAILKIGGQQFDFFSNLNIELTYASIASRFSFDAFFDPEVPELVDLLKPLTYRTVEVASQETGEKLITGTLLNNSYKSAKTTLLTNLSGYAKTGVLGDCPIPASEYPLELNGLNFQEIAERLCTPFGISVVRGPNTQPADEVFETIKPTLTQSVSQFLSETAAQKNLVISHDESGNLLIDRFTQEVKPVAFFEDGDTGLTINLNVSGQAMHNSISVLKQASRDTENASEEAFDNPFVDVFRPLVKQQSSGTASNTQEAARNSVLSEIKQGIVLTITTDRWEWVNESPELIRPNRIISVKAPNAYLFEQTNFFVESVSLRSNEREQTATLRCVLPEVFNGQNPKNIFA